MKSVDLMVFDLDGTLVRSEEDLAASVNYTLKSLGLPVIAQDTIRGFIGDGIEPLVRRALGSHAGEFMDEAIAIFSTHYGEHLLDHATLYSDVRDVLTHFDHKRKVVITNKAQEYALKIVNGLEIATFFLEIIGGGSTPYTKPDPRLLQLVMNKWTATPERTVVIGDGINDIVLARQAGALSCAFLAGLTHRDKLLSLAPDRSCEALAELKTFFS
jgi:phosphoglycolate phosphatase